MVRDQMRNLKIEPGNIKVREGERIPETKLWSMLDHLNHSEPNEYLMSQIAVKHARSSEPNEYLMSQMSIIEYQIQVQDSDAIGPAASMCCRNWSDLAWTKIGCFFLMVSQFTQIASSWVKIAEFLQFL